MLNFASNEPFHRAERFVLNRIAIFLTNSEFRHLKVLLSRNQREKELHRLRLLLVFENTLTYIHHIYVE